MASIIFCLSICFGRGNWTKIPETLLSLFNSSIFSKITFSSTESGYLITSDFKPTGDQPNAIKSITDSFTNNQNHVTLQGVTGSGKTFTVANVIQELKKPTLVLAHNKTLAAQLYSEFQNFFPNNAVEYFVSYYDYYQQS